MVVVISYLEPGLGRDKMGGKIFESKEDILYLSDGKTGYCMVSKRPPSSTTMDPVKPPFLSWIIENFRCLCHFKVTILGVFVNVDTYLILGFWCLFVLCLPLLAMGA